MTFATLTTITFSFYQLLTIGCISRNQTFYLRLLVDTLAFPLLVSLSWAAWCCYAWWLSREQQAGWRSRVTTVRRLMKACLLLILYFAATGGYKQVHIDDHH